MSEPHTTFTDAASVPPRNLHRMRCYGHTPVPQGVYPESIPEHGLHPTADSGPPGSNLSMREREHLIMFLDNFLVSKVSHGLNIDI